MTGKWIVGVLGLASCLAVGTANAAERVQPAGSVKPTVLTLAQMDGITAGGHHHMRCSHGHHYGWGRMFFRVNNVQVINNVQIAIVIGNNNTVTQVAFLSNVAGI